MLCLVSIISKRTPKEWERMVAAIIIPVGRMQLTRVVEELHIPAIDDDSFATHNIPAYRYMLEIDTSAKSCDGNKQWDSLSCLKSGKTLKILFSLNQHLH